LILVVEEMRVPSRVTVMVMVYDVFEEATKWRLSLTERCPRRGGRADGRLCRATCRRARDKELRPEAPEIRAVIAAGCDVRVEGGAA
jgi:hypothetical protein